MTLYTRLKLLWLPAVCFAAAAYWSLRDRMWISTSWPGPAGVIMSVKRLRRKAEGGARLALGVAVLGVTCATLARNPGTQAAQTDLPPAAESERGAQLFRQSCGFCHGPDATGARGPDLVRSPLVAHDVDGNLIGPVIRNGRPDRGMPPLALSDDQIKAIAAFLHDRLQQAIRSAQLPRAYPLERLLTGNAAAGRRYFEGAGGCTACHSVTGDLKGIARKYAPLDLEARMLYPEGSTSAVTVTLPSGEKVQGSLEHLDEFVVALRDASGWYRSFSRDRVQVEVRDPLAAHRELLDRITPSNFHDLFAYLETLK
jgi:cytochrome c oxidase cbb3-type subunit 3